MRLMIRWSPMSRVFSMEPDGITRAWPMVPLMSIKASATQNQAMTSRCTRWPIGRFASIPLSFVFASAFMFHRHGTLGRCVFASIAVHCITCLTARAAFAHFQLHQVGRIHARVARRAVAPLRVIHRLLQIHERNVAERIRAQELAYFFRAV